MEQICAEVDRRKQEKVSTKQKRAEKKMNFKETQAAIQKGLEMNQQYKIKYRFDQF